MTISRYTKINTSDDYVVSLQESYFDVSNMEDPKASVGANCPQFSISLRSDKVN